jgi:hypothetical protein
MKQLPFGVPIRLLLCAFASYWAWRQLGVVGLAVCAPLFGLAFASPLMSALSGSGRLAKELALRELEGQHFAFKNSAIRVTEDTAGARWLRTSDVRKVIPDLPRDPVLKKLLGSQADTFDNGRELHIRAQALETYLRKSTNANSVSFKNWVQKEVIFPAHKKAARRSDLAA